MIITKQALVDLEIPKDKSEIIVFDDKVSGFGARMRKGGARTFIFQYRRKADNAQRRYTIGKVGSLAIDKARDEARKLAGRVSSGEDPQAQKEESRKPKPATDDLLFSKQLEVYLEEAEPKMKPRSFVEVRRYLTKNFGPLHRKKIGEITRADVTAQLRVIAKEAGPIASNRARTALHAMFRWAIGCGLADENPVTHTFKLAAEVERERVLSDDELAAIWKECGDGDYGRIIRLLILTGQRRDEVGGIADSEISIKNRLWSLPGNRTKNGQSHDVPLSQGAMDIIDGSPRRAGRDRLFGDGENNFSGWSRCKLRLDARLVAGRKKSSGDASNEPEPWRLHDIRRTVVTGMQCLGFSIEVVGAVINHRSGKISGVTAIYARHDYAKEKRQALEMWAARVEALVAGKASNVVTMRSAAV